MLVIGLGNSCGLSMNALAAVNFMHTESLSGMFVLALIKMLVSSVSLVFRQSVSRLSSLMTSHY